MTQWIESLRGVSLASNGRIASLVISEENAKGQDKGDKLLYAADTCIRVERVKTDGDAKHVKFEVVASRYGPEVETRAHLLDWQRSRFECAEASNGF